MRKLIAVLIAVFAAMSVAACNHQTNGAQVIEFKQQNGDTASLLNNQPLPHFNYSQIRQNAIELETAQAKGVQTTSFFFNMGSNTPVKQCSSIGAPIATTTQISNPQQPIKDNAAPLWNGGGNLTVGQMDPNGVYTGDSTGTYVMCLNNQGRVEPAYWEGFVETEFGSAIWNGHSIQDIGTPTFKFTK